MNLVALAQQLSDLNQALEAGARLDQLVVVAERGATETEIDALIAAECAHRCVVRENIDLVVVVLRERKTALVEDAVIVQGASA